MNKQAFLKELEQRLSHLPVYERLDIIRDMEEYFNEGLQRGLTEEEIIKKLGSPKKIADTITLESKVKRIEQAGSFSQKFFAVWAAFIAILLLTPFNLLFILLPLFLITFFFVVGWPIIIILALTVPFIFLFNFFYSFVVGFNIIAVIAVLLVGLAWFGVAASAILVFSFLTILYFKGIAGIFKWNLNFIKNRMKG